MRYLSYVFWVFVVAIAVVFTSINSTTVTLDYYVSSIKVLLPLLMLGMMVVGFLLFLAAFLPRWLRVKNQTRILRQRVQDAERELALLKESVRQE